MFFQNLCIGCGKKYVEIHKKRKFEKKGKQVLVEGTIIWVTLIEYHNNQWWMLAEVNSEDQCIRFRWCQNKWWLGLLQSLCQVLEDITRRVIILVSSFDLRGVRSIWGLWHYIYTRSSMCPLKDKRLPNLGQYHPIWVFQMFSLKLTRLIIWAYPYWDLVYQIGL